MEIKETELVKVFALGGVGEIGKNMYCVEIDSDIYIVDAGLMFPEEEMFGIDIVIPDITYLETNKERVKALFLTHGHEDHIGGIAYVLRKLHIPVYGTKLTLGLVEAKLSEAGLLGKVTLKTIDANSVVNFRTTTVSFFRTNHSIPDSVGVAFHTSQGAIVYTGDFKFDQTPVDKYGADIGKMAQLGNEGVLCLLSDSTNAERPGYTGSESAVGVEISKEFYKAEGRILVASFASNVHRIQQVFDAAYEHGRKVAVVGRSMVKVVDIAHNLGYLHIPDGMMISLQDIDNYPERQVAVLTTGSQGEPMAALSRMAKNAHKQMAIRKGDTVIIAASPIPGNETSVSKTIDLLFRAGANVVYYGEKKVHVSGHGSQEELKLMLNLMKPKYFFPVHGEFRMQKAHAKLAQEIGMDQNDIFIVDKGDVISFSNGEPKASGKVPAGNVLIDGLGIGDVGNIVLRDRKLLSQDGILVVVVTLKKETKAIVSGPEIISRGFVYVRESEKLIDDSGKMVKEIVEKAIRESSVEWSTLKQSVRESLSQFLFDKTKRRPMILPIIMEV
ncbi:ribonuclease J [Ectobacillus antri]|uniref:Ribonuclease J n=1 Tax=Ectobacillus antri TaxID=2486280 RepID=A0ABT6H2H8_9BACI|nr:ribonuclease J [Ectobacillus antri]MDG4655956.1 ribonuclease J [Ectobacillus antri]MDG5752631.1 ribonuclease J [Ectobacillus antri]